MSDEMIRFEIKNKRPVEVSDFAASMEAFADEFKRHVAIEDPEVSDEVKLYIKEVRSGSIIADLIQMAPDAMSFLGDSNTMFRFSENITKAIKYLKGGGKEGGETQLSKKTLENITKIVEPTAKDPGSEMNLSQITVGGDLIINVNSLEANAMQNTATRLLRERESREAEYKDGVILYWYQTRNDLKSEAGDRSVIEKISPKNVKTVFGNEEIKKRMIRGDENPNKCAYLVDVHVQTAKGKPVLYTITNFRENLGEI